MPVQAFASVGAQSVLDRSPHLLVYLLVWALVWVSLVEAQIPVLHWLAGQVCASGLADRNADDESRDHAHVAHPHTGCDSVRAPWT